MYTLFLFFLLLVYIILLTFSGTHMPMYIQVAMSLVLHSPDKGGSHTTLLANSRKSPNIMLYLVQDISGFTFCTKLKLGLFSRL